MRSGYIVTFDEERCFIKDKNTGVQVAAVPMTKHHMFPLELDQVGRVSIATSNHITSILWHKRYGHLNFQGLQSLHRGSFVSGLPSIELTGVCKGCIIGMQAMHSFSSNGVNHSKAALKLLHADICGPMQEESLGGNLYFLLFMDDHTRYNWVYFLR